MERLLDGQEPVPSPPVEQYRQAEWASALAGGSIYSDPRWLRGGLAIALKAIFENRAPYQQLVCEQVAALGATSVLDVGCATGEMFEACRKWAPNIAYAGADAVPAAIEACRSRHPQPGWHQVSYPDLPEVKDESCEAVMLVSILRNYFPENGQRLIRAAWRIARKGIVLGFFFEPAAQTRWTANGRGGYQVTWAAAALKEALQLPGAAVREMVPAADGVFPGRRLAVIRK